MADPPDILDPLDPQIVGQRPEPTRQVHPGVGASPARSALIREPMREARMDLIPFLCVIPPAKRKVQSGPTDLSILGRNRRVSAA